VSDRAGAGDRAGNITGLAHVAIATRAADALAEQLVAALGATRGAEQLLDGGALRIVFVHLGPLTLELLEPRSADHTVARFLESHGPGLHHVSLEVSDLAAALERCRAAGVRLIDEAPRTGAHGSRIAFLHPKSLGGVLLELCEPGTAPGPRARA
jgi:methylmalonyl-CoA/ethylmalonyl-CoA epimerase